MLPSMGKNIDDEWSDASTYIITLGLNDDSEGYSIETRITLVLTTKPDDSHTVGGTLENPEKTPLLTGAIGLTLFVISYTYTLTRPRK